MVKKAKEKKNGRPSIILPFSELMEKEPCHHLVQNCLHSMFAIEQLPIHFLCMEQNAFPNTVVVIIVIIIIIII